MYAKTAVRNTGATIITGLTDTGGDPLLYRSAPSIKQASRIPPTLGWWVVKHPVKGSYINRLTESSNFGLVNLNNSVKSPYHASVAQRQVRQTSNLRMRVRFSSLAPKTFDVLNFSLIFTVV